MSNNRIVKEKPKKDKQIIFHTGLYNLFSLFKSQLFTLSVSVILTFILPLTIGIEQYGYWQVYLLYVSLVMVFGIGYTDGIYLLYGDFDYEDLPIVKLRSSLRVYVVTAIIFTLLSIILSISENSNQKLFTLISASLNIFLLLLTNVAYTVLQFTNRIKEYSNIIILGKALFLIAILTLIFTNKINFQNLIIFDLVVKIILLSINAILLKKIFFGKTLSFKSSIHEWRLTVRTGFFIMLSVYASTFILNIGKILIERFESIKVFSNYALAVSVSSFFLVFLAAFSLSIYPILKRISKKELPGLYQKFNLLVFSFSYAFLLVYYPLFFLINNWFQDFKTVLDYLPLFFIITLIQGKELLLNITFIKALRKERSLLYINLIFLAITFFIIVPIYLINQSVFLVAVLTAIMVGAKSYFLEYYLRVKCLHIGFRNFRHEILLLFFFYVVSGSFELVIGLFIFIGIVMLFLFIQRRQLNDYLKKIMLLRKINN